MKNLLFLSLMLLSGTMCFGQGKDYISWKKSGRDIDNYMRVNFHENQDRYIGQKMSVLINDLELPFKWHEEMYYNGIDPKLYTGGAMLKIDNPDYEKQMALYKKGKLKKKPLESHRIEITTVRVYIEKFDTRKQIAYYPGEDFPVELGELIITNITVPHIKYDGKIKR